ncbi:MAG: 3-oxoacyl-ACP reductase FabG [Hydrogenoanaerobacterium sp.]
MVNTVLITGASRGIGARCAEVLAADGWQVAINYNKSEAKAKTLASKINASGGKAFAVQADVSSALEVRRMASLIEAHFGTITALVNNAGIAQQKLFTEITEDDWDKMFDVNVKGMYLCAQAVSRGMISEHKGKILNIGSIWGLCGGSCEVHYSAAKAAVCGFTKALAKELAPSGITVNCVAPGVIDTEMNAALTQNDILQLKNETPLGMLGTTNDIASLVAFLLSEKAAFITGQIISPNGGFVI